ncbi:MAG: YggS family pyridoxal phosphate-dependent enzyme [Bacteroidales bacterium]|nr:YggS family pyridoxal phosphate-dependent enzyme [Bacteroidales bacterium]
MSISGSLSLIRQKLPSGVSLVVVTKTQSLETIRKVYDAGHKIMGENKAQEIIAKQPLLPDDIEWHFIGHLQTNKVKYIAPFVSMIHSIDSFKLLKEINRQAMNHGRVIRCLLQLYIASEDTKFGMDMEEVAQLFEEYKTACLKNISVSGVMGMATFTGDRERIRREFRTLKGHFGFLKEKYFRDDPAFSEISMGMSGDYDIAVQEGSTMVRIGSAIFS